MTSEAGFNGSGNAKTNERRVRLRALDLLRLLLFASIAGPALAFGIVAFVTYRSAFDDAKAELSWTCEVSREHAAQIFDSYKLVTERVEDILDRSSHDQDEKAEETIHRQLRDVIADLPQIESLIVLDRDARLRASTDSYPVDRTTDFSDRDYFAALKSGHMGTYVSRVQTSRISHREFFGWGRALHRPDGQFDGVVDIAVSPDFVAGFFKTLVEEVGTSMEGRVVTMIRDDGQILVRYPAIAGRLPMVPASNPFFDAVRKSPNGGLYVNRSLSETDAPKRMFAYRRVPGHPIYVVAGRSLAAIAGEWRWSLLRYLGVGVPATVILFLLTLATLRGARREHEALAQVRREMDRREEAEDQLRQSQKMEAIGHLTGGLAHDFNNLLTVIRSSVDLLRRPSLPEERRHRYIEAISETADRAAKLTGQLLAFARRQTLKPETFDAGDHVSSTIELLRTLIEPRIAIAIDRPEQPLFVDVDPSQFDTALVNMMVNARDAIDGQGHIRVALSAAALIPPLRGQAAQSGDFVAVAVADTGSGIAGDQLDRIFEPFFTTKGRGHGTGLGLSQVFGFAKQSKGEIDVRSELGKGTAFTLYLPRAATLAEPPSVPDTRGASPVPGTRVLVVEDDPEVGRSVTEALTELGYEPVLTTSAEEALTALDQTTQAFDLVFSDVVMPGMDGIALGQEIRRRRIDLPVLLTSGYSDALAKTGAQGFDLLRKPYSLDQLAGALQKAVRINVSLATADLPQNA